MHKGTKEKFARNTSWKEKHFLKSYLDLYVRLDRSVTGNEKFAGREIETQDWIAVCCAGQICIMNLQNTDLKSPDERRASPPGNDPAHDRHTSDHLANERTFLAWIRTSISVIGLGFVVAKFTVWLRELSVRLDQSPPARHSGLSMPLGIALMIFGGLLALIAAWRYRTVKVAILKSQPATAEGTTITVSVIVACIAVALVAYMLASA
jgi:putative membrane protein